MPEFKLHAPYKPMGDQPQAIDQLYGGLQNGHRKQTLLGATGTGKSVAWDEPITVYLGGDRAYRGPIGQLIDGVLGEGQIAESVELAPPGPWRVLAWDAATGTTACREITGLSRHYSPSHLYRLATACGRSVTVTGDHSVWVLRAGALELVKGNEVQAGDALPLPRALPEPTEPLEHLNLLDVLARRPDGSRVSVDVRRALDGAAGSPEVATRLRQTLSEFYPKPVVKLRAMRTGIRGHGVTASAATALVKRELVPLTDVRLFGKQSAPRSPLMPITESFALILGQYLAEGHASHRFALVSVRDPEVQPALARSLEACGIAFFRRADGDFVIGTRLWRDVFETLMGSHAGTKRLPAFWPTLAKDALGALLRGYFEGDGGIDRGAVTAVTLSEQLAADVTEALLRFGIWARLRPIRKRKPNGEVGTYYKMTVSGAENLQRFAEQIGFISERKTRALEGCLKAGNTNVDVVPGVGPRLRQEREQRGLWQRDMARRAGCTRSTISAIETGTRQPSRDLFARLCTALEIDDPAFTGLAYVHWSPVDAVEVVPAGRPFVYDFSVADFETFLTGRGGLFVHNTFAMAALVEKYQRPTLVLAHNKTLAAQLYGEFKDFFPENAVRYFVSYYDYYQPEAYIPRTDTYIEKDSSKNDEIDRLRLATTEALFSRRDVLIVASVSCIYALGSPEDYGQSTFTLKRGELRRRDKVLRFLHDIHYERNDINFTRGKFRVRGDTLEVFPAGGETAIRVEFFGDEIDRIVELDALTGEVLKTHAEFTFFPAKHFVTDSEKLAEALQRIEAELEETLADLNREGKILEAARLRQRTQFDMEMLRETGFCNGIENYSRHLSHREAGTQPWTLLDYFPDDYVLFIDESHMTLPQVRGMFNGDRARKLTLVEYGFRLPSALDNRPLTFDEFERMTGQTIYVSATPGPYELEHSSVVAQQVIRPNFIVDPTIEVKPTRGQIDDLLGEVNARVKRGERALVTTLTKRMAEDLADYLKEMGIKVQYLHSDIQTLERTDILHDLRRGVYDVVVGINLLREGLDLPEVSLVAILDADKEGFLRSEGSLIQTTGRAARHPHGHVIMYADTVTGSMQRAIDETYRRRKIQLAYNEEHGATPAALPKAIPEIRERKVAEEEAAYDVSSLPPDEANRLIRDLEKQMKDAAKNLEFERAAHLRDQISELRRAVAS